MNKKKSRLLTVFLVIVMLFLTVSAVQADFDGNMEHFTNKKSFIEGAFSDVNEQDWFYEYVKEVYQYGLMVGNSQDTFNPYGDVKICETITIAARIHSIYHFGTEDFVQGIPWYQTYVDYASVHGIITEEFYDYESPATRAEFAVILSNALPDEALKEINHFSDGDVPDVRMTDRFGSAVYRLYNAGILIGNDEKGTFSPDSTIRRSEVAAIVSRMANPHMRLTKNLGSDEKLENGAATSEPAFVVVGAEAARGSGGVPVHVMLRNNPGIAALALLVSYDSSLTLTSVEYNGEIGGHTMEPEKMSNPIKLLWISPFENVAGDWTLATLYFSVSPDAEPGHKNITIVYDRDDIFNLDEESIEFVTVNGSISVVK